MMMIMRNKKRPAIISCVILIWADMNADLFDELKKKKAALHYKNMCDVEGRSRK
jgi:hypothetical protein